MKNYSAFMYVIFFFVVGCSHNVKTFHNPKFDNLNFESVYLKRVPNDTMFNVYKHIKDELNLLGYDVTVGLSEVPSGQTDVIVSYEDRWMWDITMYMMHLDMQLIETNSYSAVSETSITRTSLIRKNRKEIVREALAELFFDDKSKKEYIASVVRYNGKTTITSMQLMKDNLSTPYEGIIKKFADSSGLIYSSSEFKNPCQEFDAAVSVYELRGKLYLQYRTPKSGELIAEVFIGKVNAGEESDAGAVLWQRLKTLGDALNTTQPRNNPYYSLASGR